MPPAPTFQKSLDQGARICLIVGVIVLLVANLMPGRTAKGPLLVFGEVLTILGMIALLVAWILKRTQPTPGRRRR
jgi:hypothetical protein